MAPGCFFHSNMPTQPNQAKGGGELPPRLSKENDFFEEAEEEVETETVAELAGAKLEEVGGFLQLVAEPQVVGAFEATHSRAG